MCLKELGLNPGLRRLLSVETGFMGISSTMGSNPAESLLPGICRELIGSSLAALGQSYGEERAMEDSLLDYFLRVYQGLLAISQAHDDQDEDSQDDRKHRLVVTLSTQPPTRHCV